jgi:hypothetical protein
MALAFGNETSVTIPVPGDADYDIYYLTGKAEGATGAALQIAVNIADQGNSYFYTGTEYLSLDLLVGDGKQPFPIPNGPWHFKKGTNVIVKVQNQEAATALDSFELVFLGQRSV